MESLAHDKGKWKYLIRGLYLGKLTGDDDVDDDYGDDDDNDDDDYNDGYQRRTCLVVLLVGFLGVL